MIEIYWGLGVLASGVLGYFLGRYFSLSAALDKALHEQAVKEAERADAWRAFEQSGAKQIFEASLKERS